MIRRSLLLAFAAMTAAPALAAESAKTGTGKDGPAGQYVDVSPVAIPILADGRLVNYVFVTFRVQLTAMADASKWRAKEPYFRDALARIGNRGSFADPKDYAAVDAPKLTAAFQREAVAIAAQDVKAVTLTAQMPKQRLGLPRPGRGGQGASPRNVLP
ncbi:hypothetical protein [Phenylobacterium sp.]|uniref:hypothetical protein n=1 Tax=Phenylobacterium sp. TaxID=1871053 RepID=UPI0035B4A58E